MKTYLTKITLSCSGLLSVFFLLSKTNDLSMASGLLAAILLGLNALLSLWPLYIWKDRDPFKLYAGFMGFRLMGMATALAVVLSSQSLGGPGFLFQSVLSFLVYQMVEIYQLNSYSNPILSRL